LILILLSVASYTGSGSKNEYVITRFGALPDSVTLNTTAIQQAINTAAANGGGTIVIPKGVFLSGALFFKPGTHLRIEQDGVLKGSDNIEDYPFGPSRMEGQTIDYFSALVNAENVDHFSISGKGTIDGNGLKFWKQFWAHRDSMEAIHKEWSNLEVHRPRLLFFRHCNYITIEGVKLRNSAFWTTHLYKCNYVTIKNVDVRSPSKPIGAPSSDAVDLDVCSHVTIKGCYMSVNDDAIAIKGGKGPYADTQDDNGIVEDVLIEQCTFGPSHGAVTLGSECIHGKNITIRNCTLKSHAPLLRLKLRPDTPQLYEDITVENITGVTGVILSAKPWTQFFDLKGRKVPPTAHVRNILFRNVNVTCDRIGELIGNPNDTIEDIKFVDCKIRTLEHAKFTTIYDKAVTFKNVAIVDAKQ